MTQLLKRLWLNKLRDLEFLLEITLEQLILLISNLFLGAIMAQGIRQGRRDRHFFYHAFTISLSILLLSETVAAQSLNSKIAQQPPSINSQAYSEGQKLLEAAQQLLRQGTNPSRVEAIALYEQALAIWRKIGDRASEALTLQSIGLAYVLQNDNQKALENYTQALEIRRALNDRFAIATSLYFVGGVYSNLGEKQKAIQSYNQSLTLFSAEKILHK